MIKVYKTDKNMSKKITYEEADQRFVDQGRTDIKLCEEEYNGWKNKAKFYDKEIKKHWYAIPYHVYKLKSCHPKRSREKLSDLYSITYEEAKKRFIDQGRNDIELIEEGYNGWKKKSLFWDNEINEEWWATPCSIYNKKCFHPKKANLYKAKKRIISYLEAQKRLFDKGRTDIEISKEDYTGWMTRSKFWDNIQKEYFWSTPYYMYKSNYCHPKRNVRNISNTINFEEAKQKFINQGRDDIELIEKDYKGWTKKSLIFDKEIQKHFWAQPYHVFIYKKGHPNRRKISKAQIELFQYVEKEFPNLEIVSEYKNIIKNRNYSVDIFITTENIIIEYNGDYWHCNPKTYNENYFHKRNKKYAKEIWKYDKQRKEELEKIGYKVLIVWEYDFRNNKKETLNNLKKEIVNIIEERKIFKQSLSLLED